MKCVSCMVEITKAELTHSAKAGDSAWCPRCVKRLRLNIKSKEIIWAATPQTAAVATPAAS